MFHLIFGIVQILFLYLLTIETCQWSPHQCGCAQVSPSINNRIVGGFEAEPYSWPWTVSIRRFDIHICGGVLISNRYVLTAAHCFPQYSSKMLSSYSIAMGIHNVHEKTLISKAKNIIIHDSYNFNGRNANDIALIVLVQIVDFRDYRFGFICLPMTHKHDNGTFPPIGTQTWIVGWGTTQYEGLPAYELMQVSVPITDNPGCLNKITDHTKQICAGYDQGGKDSCQGDSGGPLVVDNGQGIFELVGLVSFGVRCAESMHPGIYTRVSAYIDWVQMIINDEKTWSSMESQLPEALTESKGNYQHSLSIIFFFEIFFLIKNYLL